MTVLVVLDFVSDPQPSRLKEFIVTAGLLAAISGFAFSISRKLKALTQG
jgi:hypothetical protein